MAISSLPESLLVARYNEVRHPKQGALEFGVGERLQSLAALFGIAISDRHRILDRTVAGQNILDLLAAHILKAPVVQHALNGLPSSRSAMVEGMNNRQRRRALAQVAGYRFAQHLLCGCEV